MEDLYNTTEGYEKIHSMQHVVFDKVALVQLQTGFEPESPNRTAVRFGVWIIP
jgi:hypothetical protein